MIFRRLKSILAAVGLPLPWADGHAKVLGPAARLALVWLDFRRLKFGSVVAPSLPSATIAEDFRRLKSAHLLRVYRPPGKTSRAALIFSASSCLMYRPVVVMLAWPSSCCASFRPVSLGLARSTSFAKVCRSQ